MKISYICSEGGVILSQKQMAKSVQNFHYQKVHERGAFWSEKWPFLTVFGRLFNDGEREKGKRRAKFCTNMVVLCSFFRIFCPVSRVFKHAKFSKVNAF